MSIIFILCLFFNSGLSWKAYTPTPLPSYWVPVYSFFFETSSTDPTPLFATVQCYDPDGNYISCCLVIYRWNQVQLEMMNNISLSNNSDETAYTLNYFSSKKSPTRSPVLLYFDYQFTILDLWSFTSRTWSSTKNLFTMRLDFFVPNYPGSMFSLSYWMGSHPNLVQYDWDTGNVLKNATLTYNILLWGMTPISQSLYYFTDYGLNIRMNNINNFISGNSMSPPQFTVSIPFNSTQKPNFLNNNQLLVTGFTVENRFSCYKLFLYQLADNIPPKLSSSWECHDNGSILVGDPIISAVIDYDANMQGLVVVIYKNPDTTPMRLPVFRVGMGGILVLEDVIEYNYTQAPTFPRFVWGVPFSAKKEFPFDFVLGMGTIISNAPQYELIPFVLN